MSAPYAKLPAWADYGLIPLINLAVAFLVAGLVVMLVGENPFRAAAILVEGALGRGQNIAYTLYYATSFIFTGLAVAVAFHCSLFNIGGEGQAYVGGLGVAVVCLAFDSILPGGWCFRWPFWARRCSARHGPSSRPISRQSAARISSSRRSCSISLPQA